MDEKNGQTDGQTDRQTDSQTNKIAGREIAIALAFAGLFAAVLVTYILKSRPARDQRGADLVVADGGGPAGPSNLDVAERIANTFVGHIGAGRMPAAYAMMARSYRATTPLAAFAQIWTSSPLLSQVSGVRIASTNVGSVASSPAQSAPASGPPRAVATSSARGQLVAGAGILDAAFTFVDEEGERRILALFVGGVPVLQGVANRPAVP
jgi:hypothetical protein